jgi:nucleotide-binding universal stress UspA family protein
MSRFNRILVPIELSHELAPLMDYVANTGAMLGATVELLHVREANELAHDEETEVMTRLVDELKRHGVRSRTRTEEGDPGDAILRIAHDHQCDMIVMGTRGRIGLARFLSRSVAERVVREAPCPVVTIRIPEAEGAYA